MKRVHNFSAGPAQLPLEVLIKAQQEFVNYHNLGASFMELSHRSGHYENVHNEAVGRIKSLLDLTDDFEVLFLQGGARGQFAMLAMNFLDKTKTASYIDTGVWSTKAIEEAQKFGNVHVAFDGSKSNYSKVPHLSEVQVDDNASFVHFTSNNTIYGTQFRSEPPSKGKWLVCDASSDILSRRIDVERYGLIYAGAQKNLGPAGVTVVILNKKFLKECQIEKSDLIPDIYNYNSHIGPHFNTPPVYSVYMMNLVLSWLEKKGGIDSIEELNIRKAELLYEEIDFDDFYTGTATEESRSLMNVSFRTPSKNLDKLFIEEAAKQDMIGLKGHRLAGGIRASIYNACSLDSVKTLIRFMSEFRREHS